MSDRTYALSLIIRNGPVSKRYTIRPVPEANIPDPYLHAYTLINHTDSTKGANPIYLVGLDKELTPLCDCPSYTHNSGCKHCAVLVAAGLIHVALFQLLSLRTQQLHQAEEKEQRTAEDAAQAVFVAQHDQEEMQRRIAELEGELALVTERAAQLQLAVAAIPPARVRKPRVRKAA
jgi:hypothetical protein